MGSRVSWRRHAARTQVCLLAVAALCCAGVSARGEPDWTIHNKVLGAPKKSGDGIKKAEDVSGLACATSEGFPRFCLIVDDETQGAQVVILEDGSGEAGDYIQLSTDQFSEAGQTEPLELDAEAVAYSDGYFYVMGSHGRPRKKDVPREKKSDASAAASRHLYCIRIGPDDEKRKRRELKAEPRIRESSPLSDILESHKARLKWNERLDNDGLTIEGMAVRDGRLYAGLRAPVVDGKAAIVSIPLNQLFGNPKAGEPDCGAASSKAGSVELVWVKLCTNRVGSRSGIRDLVSFDSGFLILAGPTLDPPDGTPIKHGDYAVFYSDLKAAPRKLADLAPYPGSRDKHGKERPSKPEALLPLEKKDDRLRGLLLFDGPEEGMPTPVEIDLSGIDRPPAECRPGAR
mgnify:CR=1 FL=1